MIGIFSTQLAKSFVKSGFHFTSLAHTVPINWWWSKLFVEGGVKVVKSSAHDLLFRPFFAPNARVKNLTLQIIHSN